MKQETLLHNVILVCILAGGGITLWYARGDSLLQFIIGVITSVAYVVWGILHHAVRGDLHRKVVIEYVLVGLIAIVLLATLAL